MKRTVGARAIETNVGLKRSCDRREQFGKIPARDFPLNRC